MDTIEHTDAYRGYRVCLFPGQPGAEPLQFDVYHRVTTNKAHIMLNRAILVEFQRYPSLQGDDLRAVVKHSLQTKLNITQRTMDLEGDFFSYSRAIYDVFDKKDFGGMRTGSYPVTVPNLVPAVVLATDIISAEDNENESQMNDADQSSESYDNELT